MHLLGRSAGSAVPAATVATRRHHRRQARTFLRAQPQRPSVSENDDVAIAVAAAAAAAGLGQGGQGQQQLVESLRDGWYATASDVAAMTAEELRCMRVPVKLWASLRALLAADGSDAAAPAADEVQAHASASHAASVDAIAASRELLVPCSSSSSSTRSRDGALPDDIMQRRMPRNLYGATAARPAPVTVRLAAPRATPYALKESETSAALQSELRALQSFSCGAWYGQRVPPLAAESYDGYQRELRYLLGFAHRVRGVPLHQLSLRTLLPSHAREGVSMLMDFQHWRQQERGTAARTQSKMVKAAICLARFLYHEQSQPGASPPYRDLEVVQELATMLRVACKAAAQAPLVSDEARKWLQWDEFLGMVQALRAECAGLTASGQPRPRREVAASLQRYLIVAILSVVPDRQRTLRELEVGRTLLRRDGGWVIKHGPGDYKTGKQYGDRPPLVIAPFIYPELEAFIDTWRHELRPQSAALFVRPRTGRPFDRHGLYQTFRKAALRLTGKAAHPHLVRDMIVTHLRDAGTDELEMQALALLMAHSVKEQRSTYDRRTKAQKVTPAVELLAAEAGRLLA